jgi:hypothetical protein
MPKKQRSDGLPKRERDRYTRRERSGGPSWTTLGNGSGRLGVPDFALPIEPVGAHFSILRLATESNIENRPGFTVELPERYWPTTTLGRERISMPRHDTLIIKDTHRGLLYEDGLFRDLLPAGRYQIPRAPSTLAAFFGSKSPSVEVILVDVRGRDRTVVVQDLLTADGATISASFVVQYRVVDPLAAIHRVKNFEERLYSEAQTAARRVLRGLSVEEILGSRDEIGEEILIQVRQGAGSSGLEVTSLDFRDLIVPDDLRKIMNRAVIARRLRQAQMADGLAIDDDELALHDDPGSEDEAEMIIAKASFARTKGTDEEPTGRPEGLTFRQPSRESRAEGLPTKGFDGTLLRCRP